MLPRPSRPLDPQATKWRDFAERRRAYFVELYRSGRWKHYYTEAEFAAQFRAAIEAANDWAEIAPPRRSAQSAG